MMPRTIDRLSPFAVVIFWGSAFVWIKLALNGFSPISLVTLRFTMAAIAYLFIFKTKLVTLKRIDFVDAPRFALLVGTGVLLYHLSLCTAELALPASVASLIGQTAPLIATLLSALRQPGAISRRSALGIAISLVGAILVVSGGELPSGAALPAWAVVTCFGAPLSLAIYTVAGKPLVQKYGAANLTGQVIIGGATLMIGLTPLRPAVYQEVAGAPLGAWIAVGCLAVFSTVAAYTLWYAALRTRPASDLTTYTYLVPCVSMCIGAALFGEHLTILMLFGGLAVVGGIAVCNTKHTPLGPQSVSVEPMPGRAAQQVVIPGSLVRRRIIEAAQPGNGRPGGTG